MYLKHLELSGFKSFAKKTELSFGASIAAVVGPNGSGKSNIAEAFQWTLGEQSMKSLRGKKGEDLIFNGSRTLARLNRAAVKLTFDNSKGQFSKNVAGISVDFPEIAIERVVYRDGENEYLINGSKVRLRDVIELLSSISLGASSHHIISQNEADRILSASPKERKEMVEDALGLRIFHWKIHEAEKKLAKTKENIKEAKSLRKEIGGHLRFLEKEAEKIERARAIKNELLEKYTLYAKEEGARIFSGKEKVTEELAVSEGKLRVAEETLRALLISRKKEETESSGRPGEKLESLLSDLARKKEELSRSMGRLEGILELRGRATSVSEKDKGVPWQVSFQEVSSFLALLETEILLMEKAETIVETKEILGRVRHVIGSFRTKSVAGGEDGVSNELSKIEEERERLSHEFTKIERKESETRQELARLIEKKEEWSRARMEREKEYFERREEENTLRLATESLAAKKREFVLREEELMRELSDAALLFGKEQAEALLAASRAEKSFESGEKNIKKDIERLKIRFEELGSISEAAFQEFQSVKERDAFLEKEVLDLETGEKSLQGVIADLRERLGKEFKKGVSKINKEFDVFFGRMFGGGSASLSHSVTTRLRSKEELGVSEDEEEVEEGVEIEVNLPRKKVRGLEMLSGGERALTSIALLFAMSQVNPPPFLILDETDAALDEANSKKYGDMLEELAKRTQLILITHNRETMSRAGILYGVTMGSDGVSRLLSIKFEEAVKIAK